MVKLYFGNNTAIISSILLVSNLGYILWGITHPTFKRWGLLIIIFILINGLFWYFANIRDLYSNSIVNATDGSVEKGLFAINSLQSIIYWGGSIFIWIAGIIAIFNPQYRQNIFYVITMVSVIQITLIECSRIWLYSSMPSRFDYM